MHQDNRHILWDQGDHPSMELLRQYQVDTLPSSLQHQLERHLLDCDLCSDVLEGMALTDSTKTQQVTRSINQHIAARTRKKKRKPLPVYLTDWRVAAAIMLVMCSTVLVFYYNYQEINQQEQSIAASETKSIDEAAAPVTPKAKDTEIESIAEAVPDTIRPAIIAAVTPPRTAKATRASKPVAAAEEIIIPDPIDPVAEDPFKLTEAIPETPAMARTTETAQPEKQIVFESKTALVPESASVSRALAGKAAGVQIRGISSIATKQVQGQVLSSDGTPLPGVAVTIKGTTSGVATDANGNFTLNIPKDNATLAFSYIGYEREEKSIDAGTDNLTVNLKEDTRSLSEVVVTGYSTTRAEAPVIISAKPARGTRAYRKYLEENIRYTSESEKGRVVVQATVSPTGVLQNLQVVKSLCPRCDAEALRLIKEGPRWKPATSNGNATEQQVKISVRFRPPNKN